ncbi:MAG TPA: VWA domain-containing protein [Acidobacteriota bacterium]|nr:VWA domain-containing protein [Acidobacteriota bacterium]
MYFAQPEYLHLLWALPVLVLLLYRHNSERDRKLKRLIGPAMTEKLSAEYSRARMFIKALFLLGFFFFGILAAARPQWGAQLQEMTRHGVDIIAALDVSFSMNAEDVPPNRFIFARNHIRALLEQSAEDRIGLVVFAGNAEIHSPLTTDRGAIFMLLDSVKPGMLPEPGTSLAAAITAASSAFIEKETKHKVLVVYSDGEDLSGRVDEAVNKAVEAGVVIHTVGIGTPRGGPIPLRDDEGNTAAFRKNPEGEVVVSRLAEEILMDIAARSGGSYFRATLSGNEISSLYKEISSLEKKEMESMTFGSGKERFQYPLALAALFLVVSCLMSERRTPKN